MTGMTPDTLKRPHALRDGYWFVPKRFGFGATPVTWQGWMFTLAFCVALLLDTRFLPGILPKLIVALALIAAFSAIAARKTDGSWRWRWGSTR